MLIVPLWIVDPWNRDKACCGDWLQTSFLSFLNGYRFWCWSANAQDVGYIPLLFFRKRTIIVDALDIFMPRDLHDMCRWYILVVQLLDHSLPGTVISEVFCIQTSFFSHSFHERTQLVRTHWRGFQPGFWRVCQSGVIDGQVIRAVIWFHLFWPFTRIKVKGLYRISIATWDRKHFRLNCANIFRFGAGSCFCLSLVVFKKFNSICSGFELNVSPLHISICSWHPLRPKYWVLFAGLKLIERPRRFLLQRISTSAMWRRRIEKKTRLGRYGRICVDVIQPCRQGRREIVKLSSTCRHLGLLKRAENTCG